MKWTATPYLTTQPQVGAVEFDGNDFYFTGLLNDEPVRRTPLWALNLNTTRNLFVSSVGGNDTNSGRSKLQPLKTIRKALQILEDGNLEGYTIFVESGIYREQNPLYVPRNTSIIGDNLRRVVIKPVHDTLDIFHVTHGCYFFGMTFMEHRYPSFAFAFPCSTAIATIEDGQVATIKITHSKANYSADPNLTPEIFVESPPFGVGTNVQATPRCFLASGAITDIVVSKGGSGYSYDTPPTVTVTGANGSGSGCNAVARVDSNPLSPTFKQLIAIDIKDFGSGYVAPVTVTLAGGGGTGAVIGEVIVENNVIGGIIFDTPEDRGSGYTRAPWISIKPSKPEQVFSSPYVQNCSSITGPFDTNGKLIVLKPPYNADGITNAGQYAEVVPPINYGPVDATGAGSGIRIDGEVLDNGNIGIDDLAPNRTVIRSFVADAFTQINQGGIGHLMLNRGYAQFVSCFTTYSSVGYWARSGGFCNISNSVIDFGDIGIKAEGYYPIEYAQGFSYEGYRSTVAAVQLTTFGSGYKPLQAVEGSFVGGTDNNDNATFIVYTDVRGSVSAVAVIYQGSGYKTPPTIPFNDVLEKAVTNPVVPEYTVGLAPQNPDGRVRIHNIYKDGSPVKPLFGTGLLYDNKFHIVSNVWAATSTIAPDYWITTEPPLYWMDGAQTVRFFDISNISTGGLALEYIGSGVTYNALPYYGGKPIPENQIIDGENEDSLEYPGRIYYVTIDNVGNFRVGPYFRVNFVDGSVEFNAKTLKLPFLDSIGPFTRIRPSTGFKIPTGVNQWGGGFADEINADPALTHLDGPIDLNNASVTGVGTSIPAWDKSTLPTQSAVRGYFNQVRSDILPHYQDNNVLVLTQGVSTFKWSLGNERNKWKNIWSVNGFINNLTTDTGNIDVIHNTIFDTQYAKIGHDLDDTTNARLSVSGSNVIIGSTRSHFEVRTSGTKYKELAGMSMWGTFWQKPGSIDDTNAKRTADLVVGFSDSINGYSAGTNISQPNTPATGSWACEYLAFHVGNSIVGESNVSGIYQQSNDLGTLTLERMRIDGWGRVGIGDGSPMSQLEITTKKWNYMNWRNKENQWNGLSILSGKGTGNMGLLLGADRTNSVSYIQSIRSTGSFGTSVSGNLSLNAQGGHVGIGTAIPTPGTLVHTYTSDNNWFKIETSNTTKDSLIMFSRSNDNTKNTLVGPAAWGEVITYSTENIPISFWTNGKHITTMLPTGNVGINTRNPTRTLHVVGNAYVSGSLEVGGIIYGRDDIIGFYTSDERLKTNIVAINDALMKVNNINGVTFDWTQEARDGRDYRNHRDAGLIAQEVELVLPEVVTTRENGYKAVNYEKVIPLLVEAIKELSAKVAILESKFK